MSFGRSSRSSASGPRTMHGAADSAALAPGKQTLTSQLPVPEAPVQRRAVESTKPGGAGDVHAAAAHGTSGSGTALPHLDRIQSLFGRHDVSHVQAYVGGRAAEGAAAMGAEAFATGDRVAFARPPDVHTAAHEAAHVVQQRAGVQLKGGVGEVGDAHERNADEVADRVVQGLPTHDLLPAPSGGAIGVQRQAVQRSSTVSEADPAADTPIVESGSMLHSPMARWAGNEGGTVDAEGPVAASRAGSTSPVPHGVRSRVEAVTGADLSDVQLHRGAAAESTAAALGARAWTLGRDVHFSAGQYQPGSAEGDHLIAHELIHTVQQADIGPVTQHKLNVSQPGDPFEVEADALADRAMALDGPEPRAPGNQTASVLPPTGVVARTHAPVLQPSFISFALKMGAKQASKAMLKKFIEEQIKTNIEKIAIKKFIKRFANEADQILNILEDPWWVTAIGLIPIVGDAFELVHVPRQIAAAIKKADQLEEKVKRILSIQGRRAGELIPATLKGSTSYADELASKTYAEIVELSGSSEKARKMKKLIEEAERLMDKL